MLDTNTKEKIDNLLNNISQKENDIIINEKNELLNLYEDETFKEIIKDSCDSMFYIRCRLAALKELAKEYSEDEIKEYLSDEDENYKN